MQHQWERTAVQELRLCEGQACLHNLCSRTQQRRTLPEPSPSGPSDSALIALEVFLCGGLQSPGETAERHWKTIDVVLLDRGISPVYIVFAASSNAAIIFMYSFPVEYAV